MGCLCFRINRVVIIAVACVCRPASAVYSARAAAVAVLVDSQADEPVDARPAADSAAAEQAHSGAAGLARCAAAVDDSSPAAGLAVEDSAGAGSSPVAVEDDCSDSDTRCARAEACDPGESSQDDCWALADSSPDDSADLQTDARCAPVAQADDCSRADSSQDGCCRDDCWEPVDSAETDSPGSADSARAGLAVARSAVAGCSADSSPDDCWVELRADDRFAPVVRTDDLLLAAGDSLADSAVADCSVDSAQGGWADSGPDDCSTPADCPAAGDSPWDYSCLDARSEPADF